MTSRRNPHIFLIAMIVLLVLPVSARAGQVLTGSPLWEGFTGNDGQGLYHDLMRAIYGPGGNTIRHLEVPAKRGLIMVREGTIDIYTCLPDPVEGLQLAEEPMYEGEFHALFRKEVSPYWDGVTSMANKRVVWRLGYYSPKDFPVPILFSETTSGSEALERVLRGGADFYVDDRNLIMESLRSLNTPVDENDYRIESVGFRQYFPVFSTSKRGRELRRIFEEGMRTLADQGKLAPIYEKWHLPMPRKYQR